jgi:hypothetical protein
MTNVVYAIFLCYLGPILSNLQKCKTRQGVINIILYLL